MKQAQVPREFMFLKYEFSSLYKHNKPNSTITANFKEEQLPVTVTFTLPADEYIMKIKREIK